MYNALDHAENPRAFKIALIIRRALVIQDRKENIMGEENFRWFDFLFLGTPRLHV